MTLPFLVVYLHAERGLSLSVAGAAAAFVALASFVGNPVGGLLADRVGPRATTAAGLLAAGAGAWALAGATTASQALAAASLSGFAVAVQWPASDALLARLVPEQLRATAFGARFATMNFGLAAGAVLAGLLVSGTQPSYVRLYLLDAASFVLAAPLLALVRLPDQRGPASPSADRSADRSVNRRADRSDDGRPSGDRRPGRSRRDRRRDGYRRLASDRGFRHLWLLTAALVTVGYGLFNSAFPVLVTVGVGLSAEVLSLAFAANMATVVVSQPIITRMIAGRSASSVLAAVAAVWAGTWLLMRIALLTEGAPAVGLVVLAAVTFALAETMLAQTVPALVNRLATDELRGRYNAGSALAYTTGFAVGPAVAGPVLDAGGGGVLLVGAAGCCCLLAWRATGLGRHLPTGTDTAAAREDTAGGAAPRARSVDLGEGLEMATT
ncbi:MFS transporter [Frankia sp. CNm7]|uniref:MFS transporter n=2 Tax=Frankia nepalensis TaxID=1836974 RepID=A0A937UMB0_9ACTN|nr:MFS transporter [Frankia nepalensis]MBL7513115.1 MFS transporter [Frankia nepalensis]MBL7518330.1 MFS transporter [Frankia nepalensis]MBL7626878.1 MFS transporter [Frankia nepalensis]